jgi:hypothetical protein
VDHPYPWLKYLPADDLEDQDIDFDGTKVESPSGENLGSVEGFIVDSDSGRPYYVVVDAGGWFKSKHFLLPVGHVGLEANREALMADVSKEHVKRFPGFDLSRFDKMTVDDLKRFNEETLQACTITGAVYSYSEGEPYTAAFNQKDFGYPDWWRGSAPQSARPSPTSASSRAEVGSGLSSSSRQAADRVPDSEHVVAKAGDPSPHFEGRAQPGDVIGVETEGEQTHVGETADDENKRREDAEKAVGRRKRR